MVLATRLASLPVGEGTVAGVGRRRRFRPLGAATAHGPAFDTLPTFANSYRFYATASVLRRFKTAVEGRHSTHADLGVLPAARMVLSRENCGSQTRFAGRLSSSWGP